MEIKNFRTFKKIVESGSFSKAADQLGYAQSTVTFHIQSIETYYNKPLFNRIGKTVELTEFGHSLLEHIDVLLNTYEVIEGISLSDHIPQGVIRIGAPESLMMYRLHHIIRQYKKAYPQVEIIIINDLCSQLRNKLASGDLDLCYLLQPEYTYSHLHSTLLKKEEMCLVAPPDFEGDDFLPDASQMVLFTEKECNYREVFSNYLQSKNFYPTNVLETGSVEAIKQYIQYGFGVSYLPLYSVQGDAEKNKLRIKKHESPVTFYTQLVYHKSKWISPSLKALIDLSLHHAAGW